jgi:hypothetical protein
VPELNLIDGTVQVQSQPDTSASFKLSHSAAIESGKSLGQNIQSHGTDIVVAGSNYSVLVTTSDRFMSMTLTRRIRLLLLIFRNSVGLKGVLEVIVGTLSEMPSTIYTIDIRHGAGLGDAR